MVRTPQVPALQMAYQGRMAAAAVAGTSQAISPVALIVAAGCLAAAALKWALDKPSRAYKEGDGTVGNEYDAWTEEGILEYYWGEHIHLGYYNDADRRAVFNPFKSSKVFKDTKYTFVEEMYKWSGVEDSGAKPLKVLDVGCGIGGTSRYLANKLKGAGSTVTGISLSPKQVARAGELAKERGLDNASFQVKPPRPLSPCPPALTLDLADPLPSRHTVQVMDALNMDFPDNSFDLVWGCESGEHMPDKEKYVQEMTRVLKPGGTLVIATWCQREAGPSNPITPDEQKKLDFLCAPLSPHHPDSLQRTRRRVDADASAAAAPVCCARWARGLRRSGGGRATFFVRRYEEWAHPYFISYQEYERIADRTGALEKVKGENWVKETITAWRHSIWVGVWDPWIVIWKGLIRGRPPPHTPTSSPSPCAAPSRTDARAPQARGSGGR
jgi:MPBQ/MSBQ methyltransferase